MKKFLGLFVMLMIISSNCLAMTFSQPIEIGAIGYPPANGITIKNAIYNSGKVTGNFQGENMYDSGIAQFGNNADSIFVHYASHSKLHFGGKSKNSTIEIESGLYGTTIFQIKNDSETKFYMLQNYGAMVSDVNYVCLGKQKDGKFVKYFSTDELIQRYFGITNDRSKRAIIYVEKVYCQGNSIIIEYKRRQPKSLPITQGEFRFKWDEKAQWFGVEQVIY